MRKALLIVLLFLIIQGALGMAFIALLTVATGITGMSQLQQMPSYIWTMGASLAVEDLLMCVLVFFIMRHADENPFRDYVKLPSVGSLFLTVLTLLFLVFLVNGITEFFSMPDLLEQQMYNLTHNPLCLICLVLVGPIAEEICFRRGVMGALLEDARFAPYALVLSSLLFAAVHLNPAQMPEAFLLGLFLGWLYQRTHSLVLSVVCHILNNLVSVVFYFVYGCDMRMSDFFSSRAAFYVALFVSAVVAGGLVYLLHRRLPHFQYPERQGVSKVSA